MLKNVKRNTILKKIDTSSQEVILFNKKFILEGCTSNIFCIHNKIIFIPNKNYYRGVTMNYLLEKTNRQIKEANIELKNMHKYSEILLVGSGKGVVKLHSIPEINWKSSSDLVYAILNHRTNLKCFFFSSTSHVYQYSKKKNKESSKLEPISRYGKTKLMGEN